MRTKMILLPLVLLIGSESANWNADASKAKVEFSIKGPLGTVHGNFTGLKATIQFDVKDPGAGSISASIDPKTVSTGIGMRNHHLRSEEQYLNTDKYPLISFRSKKIEKTGNGYTANGELTLKGVTKPVQIPFTFSPSGNSGVFKGQFVIKRGDFNIGGKPGGSVGDDITISLEIPVSQ
jgi:polyisoprenoid-binding protein YceI